MSQEQSRKLALSWIKCPESHRAPGRLGSDGKVLARGLGQF
jgi:hypothetical protein